MKNTRLILALAATMCLASCNFTRPKTEQEPPKVDTIDTVAHAEEEVVAEAPFEWNFDLMWKVFMAMPFQGYDMENPKTAQKVREEKRQTYESQRKKNVLSVTTYDMISYADRVNLGCFKIQGEDKLYVLYMKSEEGGGCTYFSYSFLYDLKEGTATEIAHPFQPLEAKEFFDEETLSNITQEDWTYMQPLEDCENGNFSYTLNYDKADLLVTCGYIDFMKDFSRRLAFDWNGQEFVRKPEADVSGSMVSWYFGLLGLMQWSKIPETMEGFDIEQQAFKSKEGEAVKYAFKKGDELVMVVEPYFDAKKNEFTDMVGAIMVYSDRYLTPESFHVGSPVSDVMDAYGEKAVVYLDEDGKITLEAGSLLYLLDRADYDGELPEFEPGVQKKIDHPTFKPEAKVKAIRIIFEE